MSRKRTYPDGRVNTSIKIPRDLLEEIEAICEERMVGRGFLIERLLRRGLQHLPSVEPVVKRNPGIALFASEEPQPTETDDDPGDYDIRKGRESDAVGQEARLQSGVERDERKGEGK